MGPSFANHRARMVLTLLSAAASVNPTLSDLLPDEPDPFWVKKYGRKYTCGDTEKSKATSPTFRRTRSGTMRKRRPSR